MYINGGDEARGVTDTGMDIETGTELGFGRRVCGGETPDVTDDTGVVAQLGRYSTLGGGRSRPPLNGIEPSRGVAVTAAGLVFSEPATGDRLWAKEGG